MHLLAVVQVAEDAAAGLHFGNAWQSRGVLVGAGAATAHDADRQPRRATTIGTLGKQSTDCAIACCLAPTSCTWTVWPSQPINPAKRSPGELAIACARSTTAWPGA